MLMRPAAFVREALSSHSELSVCSLLAEIDALWLHSNDHAACVTFEAAMRRAPS